MILFALVLVALWLWQLVDCLRRESVPPLFGSERFARGLWAASFLLLDPLQVVLYVLFVRVGFLGKSGASRLRDAAVPVTLVLLAALQFGWIGTERNEPFMATGGEQRSGIEVAARVTSATANSSTTTSHTFDPVAQRRIRVVSTTDHPLGVASARAIARDLAALPFVDEVEYAPNGQHPEVGAIAPDLYVLVEVDVDTDLPTMLYTRLEAGVRFTVHGSPSPFQGEGEHDSRIHLRQLWMEGTLGLGFQRVGTALGNARYGDPAEVVREWAGKAIADALKEDAAGGLLLPPSDLGYDYRPGTAPAVLVEREAELLQSEAPRFEHHRTLWRFTATGAADAVLASMEEDLEVEGWTGSTTYDGGLVMQRGIEYLTVKPWPEPIEAGPILFAMEEPDEPGATPRNAADDTPSESTSFRAVHGQRFSDAELDVVLEQLLAEQADVRWVSVFRDRLNPDQRQVVLNRLAEEPPSTAGGWILVADLAEHLGDDDRLRAAVANARVLVQLGFDTDRKKRVLERAESLGLALGEIDLLSAATAGLGALDTDAPLPLELGREARIAVEAADGSVRVVCLTLEENAAGELVAACEMREGGSKSWWDAVLKERGDGTLAPSSNLLSLWTGCDVVFEALEDGRFRMLTRRAD